jgi:hypothetical protein
MFVSLSVKRPKRVQNRMIILITWDNITMRMLGKYGSTRAFTQILNKIEVMIGIVQCIRKTKKQEKDLSQSPKRRQLLTNM